ncbi:MAG: hypothetical protein ACRDQA_22340 [Nocardioidaceae bacterium]
MILDSARRQGIGAEGMQHAGAFQVPQRMMTMPRSLEEIIAHADELADAFEDYEPDLADEGKSSPLVALRLAAARRVEADRDLLAAVSKARDRQISWAAIGNVLGTSGEAARQRYGELVSR